MNKKQKQNMSAFKKTKLLSAAGRANQADVAGEMMLMSDEALTETSAPVAAAAPPPPPSVDLLHTTTSINPNQLHHLHLHQQHQQQQQQQQRGRRRLCHQVHGAHCSEPSSSCVADNSGMRAE